MEASPHFAPRPAELAVVDDSATADVLPFPSPAEKGFLDTDTPISTGGILARLSRTTLQVANVAFGQPHLNSRAMPKGVVVSEGQYSGRFLVTEPSPETAADPSEALNTVFHPGLTEFGDLGSALRMHVAYAERHPDQRVITKPTLGISHAGEIVSARELRARCIETMAAINRLLLRHITQDGEVVLAGTSLGSYLAAHMAEQDLAAADQERLNLRGLTLVASAVVALNVDDSENFRDPDIDQDEHRQHLTAQFFDHVPKDLARMARTNPLDVWACAPIVSAYTLAPHKALSRAQAIIADFNGVKQGMEWSALKRIASEIDIKVLGGSLDPLIIEQEPQWDKLASLFPGQVRQRIVPGMGHLMTIDTRKTMAELELLESEEAA